MKSFYLFTIKRFLYFFIFSAIFFSTLLAYTCQYDNFPLYNTGKTKIEWGKLVYLYKCSAGHKYWIASSYGAYGMDLSALNNNAAFSKSNKISKDFEKQIINASKHINSKIKAQNHVIKNREIFKNLEQALQTRQIPGANRLFKENVERVVLLSDPEYTTLGSGTIINNKGDILTNWHVVENSGGTMHVWFYNKDVTKIQDLNPEDYSLAEVIGSYPSKDMAILRINGKLPNHISPVSMGKEYQLEVAQDAFAIGHPEAEIWSLTQGFISALRDDYESDYLTPIEFKADVIQTQTPTNPGNSGGPLFDKNGKMIGINSFGKVGSQGLNFAVRIGEVNKFIKDVSKGKHKPSFTAIEDDEPQWEEADIDENGIIDALRIDLDGDGEYDLMQIDENEDGTFDYIVGDFNNDHLTDVLITDNDNNGTFEYFLIDTDFDGKWDEIGIDTNGDMEPDSYFGYDETKE